MKTVKAKAHGTKTVRGRTKRVPIIIDGKIVGYETILEEKGMEP